MSKVPKLRVPKSHQPALIALAGSLADEVQALSSTINDLREPVSRDALIKVVKAAKAAGLNADPEALVDALLSLLVLRTSLGWELNGVVSEVERNIEIATSEKSALRENLSILLGNKRIQHTAKAVDLASAYASQVHVTRVLTDLRPIFDESIGEVPVGWMIMHQLEISSSESGRLNELFIAATDRDLEILRDQIDRALKKSSVLSKIDSLPIHAPEE